MSHSSKNGKRLTSQEAKDLLAKRPCTCCSVFHNPNLCAQCQVAGCAATAGKKGHKCRLQGTMLENMQKSEFQIRNEYTDLQKKYADLLVESQRLARLVLAYENKSGSDLPPAFGVVMTRENDPTKVPGIERIAR